MFQLLSNLALTQLGQLTLLIMLVGLAHRLLAERAPMLTLWLWTLVLVKAVTPPVFSSPVGLFSWLQAPAASAHGESFAVVRVAPVEGWAGWILPVAIALWLTGSLLMLALTLYKKRRLEKLLRRDALDTDHPLTIYANTLAERYGLRKPARVVVSQDNYGPAVAGVLRPTIVFPESLLSDRDPAVLRPVLLHELVHITRRDTWSAVLAAAARVAWWFNPAVWWATRQAEQLVERAVDLRVTRDLETSLYAYGRGLFRVLEMRAALQTNSGAVGLRPCQITTERLEFLRRNDEESPYGRPRLSRFAQATRVAAIAGLATVLLPALPTDALLPKCDPAGKIGGLKATNHVAVSIASRDDGLE